VKAAWSWAFALALLASAASAQELHTQELRSYVVAGDSIPESLTGEPGDAQRGRALVANRTVGLCLLCHSGPLPEVPLQGNLAPSLAGAGARWSAGQLRLRLVDPSRLVPDTIMPPYYRLDHLQRVAHTYDGKTILGAQQIEDVVVYLVSLKE
jgi:L-cysteine S-thiosulfotransferase